MLKVLFSCLLLLPLFAKESAPKSHKEVNATSKAIQEAIKAQMEREKKYAKEQKFYQGKEYNLKEKQVDPKQLEQVPVIEPDYDFDITDVYRDDI